MKIISIKKKDGTKLHAVLDAPEALKYPLIIACHGFGGKKEDFAEVVPHFLKNNIAILRFDFSGYGDSDGKFEDITLSQEIDDLLAVYEYSLKLPRVSTIGLFGHSLGADVALLFSIAKKVHAVVASAPPLNFKTAPKALFDISEKAWREDGFVKIEWYNNKKIKYSFYEDLMKYDMKQLLPLVTAPALIIHGEKDELIPIEDAKEIYNLLKGAKSLKIISGADHNFNSKSEEWLNTALFWFLKWLK